MFVAGISVEMYTAAKLYHFWNPICDKKDITLSKFLYMFQ